MKIKIGVMGSAQGPTIEQEANILKAEKVGKAIAENNCILVNGACPGLPDDAARGAKKAGGFVLGISPAFSFREHVEKYLSPTENYDLLLFTGMGLMERDIVNIRSSDAIITVGGGVGTLNEFIVAYDEGKFIGILTGSGGISDKIPEILGYAHRKVTDRITFDSEPERLIEKLVEKVKTRENVIVEDQRVINKAFNPFD